MIKFLVDEQVKEYGRSVQQSTIDWWKNQPKEAQYQLKPSTDDVSITELYDFFVENRPDDLKKVYTRGNTFDPIFFDFLMNFFIFFIWAILAFLLIFFFNICQTYIAELLLFLKNCTLTYQACLICLTNFAIDCCTFSLYDSLLYL